jgi:hypothetical protein
VTTAGLAERPLESIANNFSPYDPKTVSEQRKRRLRGQEVNWAESRLKRCRDCGRVAITSGGSVAVRESAGVVGFAGLATCGSVWACGVCNAKIMARRQLEIGAAVEQWEEQGGSVAFGTQTMRHWSGHRLEDLWACLSKAWQRVIGGKAWKTAKKRYGIAGWLRVVEVTFGLNGWHVHVHYLLFLESVTVATDLDALKRSMFGRWSSALRSLGLPAPLLNSQDLRVLDGPADEALAGYFTKAVHSAKRIGLELTSSQTKTARGVHKTRSVWDFLDDVLDLGDADALQHWHEWQRGSKGRRQLTWSKGLRELLGLRYEKSDEDVAAEELGSKVDDLVIITAAGWRTVIACRLRVQILESVYRQGFTGLRALLDTMGVEYELIGERAA